MAKYKGVIRQQYHSLVCHRLMRKEGLYKDKDFVSFEAGIELS